MKLNNNIFRSAFLALVIVFPFPAMAQGNEVMPTMIDAGAQKLTLNGMGTRKKAFISLYNAGLYLLQPGQDAAAIIANDEVMSIRISIVSGLISSKKMSKAMTDGFNKSTAGNTKPIEAEIAAFQGGFSDEISKQDVFDLVYQPEKGVEVIKNGVSKVVVAGLPFKQALFGIWLSEDPIQKSLKKGLLALK